jgi:hypothetical protein
MDERSQREVRSIGRGKEVTQSPEISRVEIAQTTEANPSRSWMKSFVNRFQVTLFHMRVDLRSPDIRVSKKFLDDPQICPVGQQVRRKRVA